MATSVASRDAMPKIVHPAYLIVCPCVIIVPGCITQARIVISAIEIPPLAFLANALLLNTWPRKATKTVTKDSSMLLAKAA